MKTVFEFYMECSLIPINAKVNIYDAMTKKKLMENWQDGKEAPIDDRLVRSYKWNPKTNLLRIYV